MKTICIAGHCCSGKTTAIQIMAQHLPNSAIVRGDAFLLAALLRREKEFEEIYKTPLDMEKPYESFMRANNDASAESINTYRRFFALLAPFLECKIEQAIAENKKHDKDFILVEYVTLPIFKIWKRADCRIMIVTNKELRQNKLRERTVAKYGSYHFREGFDDLRENAFGEMIEAANNIDYSVANQYDGNFEKDLLCLCRQLL